MKSLQATRNKMLKRKLYTLVFIRTARKVLLGLKKRGFGVGKWNGFGGKVEHNETILDAASRELEEESCVRVKNSDLKHIGCLEFAFEGDPVLMDVKVFSANVYQGTPAETEEMSPKWFDHDQIPFTNMWPDDKYWFPYMLKEKPFYAKFYYRGFDTILKYKIHELESMEHYRSTD